MSNLKLISSLSLLTIIVVLLLQNVSGNDFYVRHSCRSSMEYTKNDPFEANLKRLLVYFSSNTSRKGFSLTSFGKDEDLAYGHALCRGDVSPTECKTCVRNASVDIRTRCPYKKSAVIWHEKCLLKYANAPFFGVIDHEDRFQLRAKENVSEPKLFDQKARVLLTQLADEASIINSTWYAARKLELIGRGGSKQSIFGMVQCTKDLWPNDCKTCLYESISLIPRCCGGRAGAQIISGSCIVRYDTYPFINI